MFGESEFELEEGFDPNWVKEKVIGDCLMFAFAKLG